MEIKQLQQNDQHLLELYFKDLSHVKSSPLSSREERELCDRIKKGDKDAAEKLIKSNLRFVVSVAYTYVNQGIPLADLINIGNIGLMNAIPKFDASKNFKFISYAVWWIRQAILQTLAEQSRICKLPLSQANKFYTLGKIKDKLEQELRREPTIEEIRKETGYSLKDLERMFDLDSKKVLLDGAANENQSIHELVASPNDDPDDDIEKEDRQKNIEQAFYILNSRERKIIELYYGFSVESPYTLNDIGDHLGVTRERIRQIRDVALKKIKRVLLKWQLKSI